MSHDYEPRFRPLEPPQHCGFHERSPFYEDTTDGAALCALCEYEGHEQEVAALRAERDALREAITEYVAACANRRADLIDVARCEEQRNGWDAAVEFWGKVEAYEHVGLELQAVLARAEGAARSTSAICKCPPEFCQCAHHAAARPTRAPEEGS